MQVKRHGARQVTRWGHHFRHNSIILSDAWACNITCAVRTVCLYLYMQCGKVFCSQIGSSHTLFWLLTLLFGGPVLPTDHPGLFQKHLLHVLRVDHSHVHCSLLLKHQAVPLWPLPLDHGSRTWRLQQVLSLVSMAALRRSVSSKPSAGLFPIFPAKHLPPKQAWPWWKVLAQLPAYSPLRKGHLACCCCHLSSQFEPFCGRNSPQLVLLTLSREPKPVLDNFPTPSSSERRDVSWWAWVSHGASFFSPSPSPSPNCLVLVLRSTPSVSTLVSKATPSFLLHSWNFSSRYLRRQPKSLKFWRRTDLRHLTQCVLQHNAQWQATPWRRPRGWPWWSGVAPPHILRTVLASDAGPGEIEIRGPPISYSRAWDDFLARFLNCTPSPPFFPLQQYTCLQNVRTLEYCVCVLIIHSLNIQRASLSHSPSHLLMLFEEAHNGSIWPHCQEHHDYACFDLDLTRGLVVFTFSLLPPCQVWSVRCRLGSNCESFFDSCSVGIDSSCTGVRFALQSLICSLTESANLSCRHCTNFNLHFIMFGSVVQDFIALLQAQLCLTLWLNLWCPLLLPRRFIHARTDMNSTLRRHEVFRWLKSSC